MMAKLSEDQRWRLRELVFQAFGQVSMCWEPIPGGLFQSEMAVQVGDDLCANLEMLFVKEHE